VVVALFDFTNAWKKSFPVRALCIDTTRLSAANGPVGLEADCFGEDVFYLGPEMGWCADHGPCRRCWGMYTLPSDFVRHRVWSSAGASNG